jgi:hypothetical protein
MVLPGSAVVIRIEVNQADTDLLNLRFDRLHVRSWPDQLTNVHSSREQQRIRGWIAQTGAYLGRTGSQQHSSEEAAAPHFNSAKFRFVNGSSGRSSRTKFLARQIGLEIITHELTDNPLTDNP